MSKSNFSNLPVLLWEEGGHITWPPTCVINSHHMLLDSKSSALVTSPGISLNMHSLDTWALWNRALETLCGSLMISIMSVICRQTVEVTH